MSQHGLHKTRILDEYCHNCGQVRQLEGQVPFTMTRFHRDNGSECLNWPLYEYLTGRPLKVPWTRIRCPTVSNGNWLLHMRGVV